MTSHPSVTNKVELRLSELDLLLTASSGKNMRTARRRTGTRARDRPIMVPSMMQVLL